jgi:hypothetical protein
VFWGNLCVGGWWGGGVGAVSAFGRHGHVVVRTSWVPGF